MSKNSLNQFEEEYARLGLTTFGMNIARGADGKKSLKMPSAWQKIRTTKMVRADQNAIGVLCGLEDGLVVVDLDRYKDGDVAMDGIEAWERLIKHYGGVNTFSIRTGSGGRHYYFRAPVDICTSKKRVTVSLHRRDGTEIPVKIDLLTRGSHAIGGGSYNPIHDKYYEKYNEGKIEDLPEWLKGLFCGGYIYEFSRGEFCVRTAPRECAPAPLPERGAPLPAAAPARGPCDIPEEKMTVFLDMIDILARDYDSWRDVIFSLQGLYGRGEKFERLAHHFSSSCRSKYNKVEVDVFITNIRVPEYGYRLNNLLELCKKKKLDTAREYLTEIINEGKTRPIDVDVGRFDGALYEGQTIFETFEFIKELNRRKLCEAEYMKMALPRIFSSIAYIVDQRSYVYKTEKKLEISKELPRKSCIYMVQGKNGPQQHRVTIEQVIREYEDICTMFDTMTFFPIGPEEKDPTPAQRLNTWRGFKAKLLPREDICMDKFSLTLSHVDKILCAGEKVPLGYFVGGYLGNMFRKPSVKMGVAINFVSKQGSGKGSFMDNFLIPHVFGEYMSTSITGVDKLAQRFNTVIMDKLFISVNELPKVDLGARNAQFDILKSLITDTRINVEIKNGPVFEYPTYARFVFSTNHELSMKIEEGDRRYAVLKCSEERVGDYQYFAALDAEMQHPETADHFFSYCYYYEYSGNPRRAPMTAIKYDMIESSVPSPRRHLLAIKQLLDVAPEYKYEVSSNEYSDYQRTTLSLLRRGGNVTSNILSTDLYNNYKIFCEEQGDIYIVKHPVYGRMISGYIQKPAHLRHGQTYDLNTIVGL